MDFDLNQLDQENVLDAMDIIIAQLRTANPSLDLRAGTVVRELLVRVLAEGFAATEDLENRRRVLQTLGAMLAADYIPTTEELNAVLSVYGMSRREGSRSLGILRVAVADGTRAYALSAQTRFSLGADAEIEVETLSDVLATAADQTLKQSADGAWFFTVPAQTVSPGTQTVLVQGVGFYSDNPAYIRVTAETEFSGGADEETAAEAAARVPSELAHRSPGSKQSITGMLRTRFPAVLAVGVQGFGDPAQYRSRHNALGMALTGYVDVYVRDFSTPALRMLDVPLQGSAVDGYFLQISQADAVGVMGVLSVADARGPVPVDEGNPCAVRGASYSYTVRRQATTGPEQPVLFMEDPRTYANTVYQTIRVDLHGFMPQPGTTDLRVTLAGVPALSAYQDFMLDEETRPLATDYLVRAPVLALLYLKLRVHAVGEITEAQIEDRIIARLASRAFSPRLKLSELFAWVQAIPAVAYVDASPGRVAMSVDIHTATGIHVLTGAEVDLSGQILAELGVTPETTALVALRSTLDIEVIHD